MKSSILFHFFTVAVFFLCSCGGGTSGTALGSGGGDTKIVFSGVLVSGDGKELPYAQVTLLDTDESVQTDEAGAFEFPSRFDGRDATFEVEPQESAGAVVTVNDVPEEGGKLDFSVQYDTKTDIAAILDFSLRARIIGTCSPLFLNTRTIRQTGVVADGYKCTVEVEMKSGGTPLNNLLFQLERRGCSQSDSWQFVAAATTGESGAGIGDIEFPFRNDEKHCVYRVVGPLGSSEHPLSLTSHIHSLRKQKYDKDQ